MRIQTILIALSTLLRLGVAAYDVGKQTGVGISLSAGYATVSAVLPDGSYIDIAKVEGGATYKAYMLGSREESIKDVRAKYCPFSRQICQHWPLKGVQTQNPLAPMLKALVASAESALETTITSVAVSSYDIGTIDYGLAKIDVGIALSELGVDSHNRLDLVGRQLAPALGIQGNCSDPYTLPHEPGYHQDPEQIFFSIEYTRDSMTAGLWREECDVLEVLSRMNAAHLGHNVMQTCRETAKDPSTCQMAFKSELRRMIKDQTLDGRNEIAAVLLFGERADDDAMLVALRQVLKEQFPNGDSVDFSRVENFSPDPAFAGSRAMAEAANGPEYKHGFIREL